MYGVLWGEHRRCQSDGSGMNIGIGLIGLLILATTGIADDKKVEPKIQKFARFRHQKQVSYGIVEGNMVREITAPPYAAWKSTEKLVPLIDVKLLPPVQPRQVLALAGNYRSHLAGTTVPEKFQIVQPFFKTPACLVGQDDAIVLPKDSTDVHYEAELVIVMGKRAKNVTREKALDHVLGVTCGNDISERVWQKNDVQWWRAKGSDTFGPVGPFIVSGIPYDNLQLTLRVNGQVKQQQRTRDLIHDVAKTVSVISNHITLQPGDLIFTGTPGKTEALHVGDVVEVELEGVGILRNPVVAEK